MIGRDFKSAFVRKLGYMAAAAFVALLLSIFGMGKAQAHITVCPTPATGNIATCDQGIALEQANNFANATAHVMASPYGSALSNGWVVETYNLVHTPESTSWGSYMISIRIKNTTTAQILTLSSDIYAYSGTCAQRNASLGGVNQKMRYASSNADQCVAGCKYRIVSDATTKTIYANAPGQTSVQTGQLFGGMWEYSGDTCPAPSKPREEEQPKTECVGAGSGQTYCLAANGNQCHTASTGRTICWAPGETGTKTDGTTTQMSLPGNQPPGTLEGSTHTSTTNISTTTSTTSSITTINNYTTNNGSPAGPSNSGTGTNGSGVPNSTSPAGTGSGGEDEQGEENASSGGGSCDAPPVSTGDPILVQIATQTWNTRCNTKKGELTGNGTCNEDGTLVGFVCTGDPVNCGTARRAAELKCAADRNRADWLGDDTNADAEDDLESVWAEGDGAPDLDASGLGWGRACPQLPEVFGRSIQSPFLCDSLAIIGALVLLLAYFHAGRIVAR